jgi:hypothetical protein
MKKKGTVLAAATALGLLPGTAGAFCGVYVGSPGDTMTNRASEVVLARDNGRTTLSLVMDFTGNANDFALLLPVPVVLGPEDVHSVDFQLLDWIAAYSTPRFVEYECESMYETQGPYGVGCGGTLGCDGGYATGAFAPYYDTGTGVTVTSEFSEYGYDFVVLDAEQSDGLVLWLDENGYAVPDGGEAILQEYIDSGTFFLAAKIDMRRVERRGEWLPPIQFVYPSSQLQLPIRIGTISAEGAQDVVMYVLSDIDKGEVGIANYPELEVDTECMARDVDAGDFGSWYSGRIDAAIEKDGAGWVKEYSWDLEPSSDTATMGYHCDPCTASPAAPTQDGSFRAFGLDSMSAHLTRIRMRYTPEQATEDLVLYESGVLDVEQQVRIVSYKQELEFLYPVCDEGFVDNPGTCPDPYTPGTGWPWAASGLLLLGGGVASALRRRA